MSTKGSNVLSLTGRFPPPLDEPPAKPLKILVIDDSPEDRMAVRFALETRDYILTEADCGRSGLAMAAAAAPDCVLLDHGMPDYDGLQVLDALRGANDGDMPCPVIMLTASQSGPTAAKLLKAGALDYMNKQSFNADHLRHIIDRSIARHRLQQENRGMQARNAQLAAIITASNDAILCVDLDLVVQTWNPGATAMFGYGEDEAIGHSLDELIVPPDATEDRPDRYLAIIAERRTVRVEAIRRHRDGRLVPVEINAAPILDQKQDIVAVSIMYRDISERKRADEKVRMLMGEVEHRSKNILATVQAIANLTTATTPAEFRAKFGQRLQALSASHSLLISGQWQGVNIKDLVNAQFAHLTGPDGSRLTIDGPSCTLSPGAAQSLGMALHELATNASKYGALSNERGTIRLQWAIVETAAGPLFTIQWSERDGPTVQPPKRKGFGSSLIGRMIEAELRGKVTLDFDPKGLDWRLECPFARVGGKS